MAKTSSLTRMSPSRRKVADRVPSSSSPPRQYWARTVFVAGLLAVMIGIRFSEEHNLLHTVTRMEETQQQVVNATSVKTTDSTKSIVTATEFIDTTTVTTTTNQHSSGLALQDWRKKRVEKDIYNSFFVDGNGEGLLKENADASGPILDFAIVGFPKCGTTAVMRTLASVTTMPPEADVCTPVANAVWYSYNNWAEKYGNGVYNFTEEKPLKGNKCPQWINGINDIATNLPKTNLIVGIRHPVLWFQSLVNMRWFQVLREKQKDVSKKDVSLAEHVSEHLKLYAGYKCKHVKSNGDCFGRSRFHVSLARLGKTPLDKLEMELLKSEINQSRRRRNSISTTKEPFVRFDLENPATVGVRNKVFLFESTQGKEEYFYQELARFVNIDPAKIVHQKYTAGVGINDAEKAETFKKMGNLLDICLPEYDHVRKELLPISYTLGQWLLKYMIPASHHRDDLVIPNVTAFESIVESFSRDPCEDRLVRNEVDGEYYLANSSELHESSSGVATVSKDVQEWRKKRVEKDIYNSFFVDGNGKGLLKENADASGPILDFAIVGFPKCGTTAMMRTLASVTTMPSDADVCTPVSNTVWYSYNNWAEKYGNGVYNFTEEKPLKGNKCPQWINGINDIATKLPKTNLIVGIRHPVLWFQSFANQHWLNSFQHLHESVADFVSMVTSKVGGADCRGVNRNLRVCIGRSRFHLALAELGKTPLDKLERDLLKSEILQTNTRRNLTSSIDLRKKIDVPNKVFLFESTQGKEEYFYRELARFVNIDPAKIIPHEYTAGVGINDAEKAERAIEKGNLLDICLPEYDHVRKELLPISYTLGQWLLKYMIPASHHRDDLVIPNVTAFESIVESFLRDPCEDRLVRNEVDGEYYLSNTEQ